MNEPCKNVLGKWGWFIVTCFLLVILCGCESTVNIPDSNLRRVLKDALGGPHKRLTVSSLANLKSLIAYRREIHSLEGLQHCVNLTQLFLHNPLPSDSAFRDEWGLYLSQEENRISDLRPLSGLVHLEILTLSHNQVTDIHPLAGLKNLQTLWLEGNGIQDFNPLSNLTHLKELCVWNYDRQYAPRNGLETNRFIDLAPLSSLVRLEVFRASRCEISEIGPISQLVELKELSLFENKVQEVTPLAHLKNLQTLSLAGNQIEDIRPLEGLSELKYLNLSGNPITDWEPLLKMEKLVRQRVHGAPPEVLEKIKQD